VIKPCFDMGFEDKGFEVIIGVDEAGRGPLAGPVVAGAVWLKKGSQFESRIDDSKKLSSRQREAAFLELITKSHFEIGIVDEKVIDSSNIRVATRLAMEKAAIALITRINRQGLVKAGGKICILVDGNMPIDVPGCSITTVVKGDAKSMSIAAASIAAKVKRDRIMVSYDNIWPQYGFGKHKGYPTMMHRKRLAELGPCPIHRLSFAYV